MVVKSISSSIICFAIFISGYSQALNLKGLEKLPVKEYTEEKDKKGDTIQRENKNIVILQFQQDFEDSVLVYKHNLLILYRYIKYDSASEREGVINYKFSDNFYFFYSGYANIGVGGSPRSVNYGGKGNIPITIIYKEQKKYIQFKLNRKFPLYVISFLKKDGQYTVSAKKSGSIE